jgi:pilus assembly protein CpaF
VTVPSNGQPESRLGDPGFVAGGGNRFLRADGAPQPLTAEAGPDFSDLAASLHETLIGTLDVDRLQSVEPARARELVMESALALLSGRGEAVYGDDRRIVTSLVADEVLGLGPLQPLLNDPTISEVMVNGPETVYYERDGVITESRTRFRNEEHVRRIAERILTQVGRRIDESTPMVDARLPDGSRVNITIPPATPRYPTITIRKFRIDRYRIEDLMAAGTLSEQMRELFAACVQYKLNILISGGTGSGKTTLLNALSTYIPESERIITIEDPAELQLQQRHVVSMEARPPDMMGQHEISQRDLLRNALRMRPDRIIIGEVRGAEAFEMMQAMNTGHEGSLSTVHANSPRDALARVENMVLMAGVDLPSFAIREQMGSALHLIIQLQRFPDGSRKIVRVSEVTGMEGTTVTMQDLFVFRTEGVGEGGVVQGRFLPTGLRPTFSELLRISGCELSPALFVGSGAL